MSRTDRELKAVTMNTLAYEVHARKTDRRSESINANEDMHIVAIEHFIGVSSNGCLSDNGHILSKSPDNPWVKWAEPSPTGMEPTGSKGYFGYCGRDYYTQVGGINDLCVYEGFPSGYFLVKRGEKLYMHCYAANATDKPVGFHNAVHLIYW
jgi:hypothetical protein